MNTHRRDPDGPRVERIERGPLTFGVIDTGPLDGAPVVLLHGFPQRATAWAPTTEILNTAGMRTYALDQRGYSPGARPRGRRHYRVSRLVDDVAALIDRIGEPVTLVGHDWGAVVAWSVATRRPELVRYLVAASVPHPAAFFAATVRGNQLLMSWYIGLFQLPFLPELLCTRSRWMSRWLERSGMPPGALEDWRREFLRDDCLPGALGWYRALPLIGPRQVRIKATVPTTFIWSDGDFALGRTGARLTPGYVTAPYRYVELNGHSHWLLEEAPDTIAREVILSRG